MNQSEIKLDLDVLGDLIDRSVAEIQKKGPEIKWVKVTQSVKERLQVSFFTKGSHGHIKDSPVPVVVWENPWESSEIFRQTISLMVGTFVLLEDHSLNYKVLDYIRPNKKTKFRIQSLAQYRTIDRLTLQLSYGADVRLSLSCLLNRDHGKHPSHTPASLISSDLLINIDHV